jgi:hypothetical protein
VNNSKLLTELAGQIAAGELETKEVLAVLGMGIDPLAPATPVAAWPVSAILYYLGGAIVFMGMAFFTAQQWHYFGPTMRVFVTLGAGVAALVTGVLLNPHRQLGAAGSAFFLLSGLLLPIGLIVAYEEAGVRVLNFALQLQILGILTIVYLATFLLFRKTLLLIFALLFGTCCYFGTIDLMVGSAPVFDPFTLAAYQILAAGLSLMFLGHGLAAGKHHAISGWLYGFGVAGFLGAALALGQWKPNQNVFWEIIYPGLVFAVIFLSTRLQSKTFLIFGSLALGSYLSKITIEYFSDSLGWAFALVIVGFLQMAVAFLALRIQRQYIILKDQEADDGSHARLDQSLR